MKKDQFIAKIAATLHSDIDRAAQKRAILSDVTLYFSDSTGAQAAAWLQDRPNRTIKEAAFVFGVAEITVQKAKARGPYPKYEGPYAGIPDAPPRQSGRAVQAAAWLQVRPFRTLAFAARLFGVTVGAVSAARSLGPYPAYEGPHDAIPDTVPANLPTIIEAAEWAAAHPGMALPEVAKGYGVKLGDLRRWINRDVAPR